MNLFSIKNDILNQPKKKTIVRKRKPIILSGIKREGVVYGSSGNTQSRTSFKESEYNLGEIAKVMDIEAYVRQAFGKHIELCLKEGYEISSRNEQATNYIKMRFREMAEVSGVTFEQLIRGITQSLVAYSNVFIAKARNNDKSSGNPIPRSVGAPLSPVAGYFLLDPTSVQIKRDLHGKVLKYKQKVPGNPLSPEFKPEDMIHIFYDRKEGLAFGTPYIIPALDDIRTLRRMEENIEMLITQHLFPLYQYIVGTEDNPAEIYDDGTTEVDVIKDQIENMPTEGSIVTPERHEIKNLGAEGKALDAAGYLEYFEKRVLAGLGISEIALGRGGTANRSTASVIDKMLQDRCKDFQDVMEAFANEFIMKELLYEGGFILDGSEDNFVKIKFNEIDIDSMLKVENHSVFKYEHDAITETEVRELLGKDPISDEQREDMYFERVAKPKAIIMAVDEPFCYSKDTEILTENGWKYFYDLLPEDKVATLYNGRELKYEIPINYFDIEHVGKMYYLKTRFLDVCVTPNHKLYICKRNHKDSIVKHNFKLEHAEKLFGKYKQFKRSAMWAGNDIEYFELPELKRDIQYSSKKYFAPRKIKIEDWLEFLGWYLSEGCSSHLNGRISISQHRDTHKDNYNRISEILSKIGVTARHSNNGHGEISFSDFQIKKYLHEKCGVYSKDKHIPIDIKSLSPRLLRILLETLMEGDGETKYHYVYSTISKQLADDLQEIALKTGFAANIRIEKREHKNHYDVYKVAINRDKYIDIADRDDGRALAESSVEDWIDYEGKVYCVETSTGVVYIRRNGKARWCGNTTEAKGAAIQKVSKEEKKKKETSNREKPSNQHGTKTAKTREKKDKVYKDLVSMMKHVWYLTKLDVADMVTDMDSFKNFDIHKLKPMANISYTDMKVKASGLGIDQNKFDKFLCEIFDDLGDCLVKKIKNREDKDQLIFDISGTFESLSGKLEDIAKQVTYNS